jgi:putative membrane protein
MQRIGRSTWLLVALVVACGGSDSAEQPAADTTAATVPEPATPALTDAEIAHIAVTANTIDIEAGEQANQKATDAEVKQFAQTMIKDHTAVNQEASTLAQSLSLTPTDNAVSQELKSAADAAKTEVGSRSGAEFDKAYIAREVAYHQAVLDALDQTLIPGAQNAQLKALLEKVRPAIASHLQMAQQLQTKLGA